MPRFAFSTNAFRKCDVVEAITSIAEAGYDGVEIMLDEPHLFPATVSDHQIRAARDAIEAAGLQVSNCNAFTMHAVVDTLHPSWIEPDENRRRERIRHTVDAIRVARRLGAPSISTEPGGPIPPAMTREQAMTLFVQGIAEVLPVAEECGVDILIEPEPGLLIESVGQSLAFFARIAHLRLGLNFDIGHFFCVGENPQDAFRALQPHVRHVHLEDIAATREHRHLLPGRGAIPLPYIIESMTEAGYDGWITVELYPYQDAPYETAQQALQYLREHVVAAE